MSRGRRDIVRYYPKELATIASLERERRVYLNQQALVCNVCRLAECMHCHRKCGPNTVATSDWSQDALESYVCDQCQAESVQVDTIAPMVVEISITRKTHPDDTLRQGSEVRWETYNTLQSADCMYT